MANNTKMNISYTIRAVDRFTKTHQKLERQLDSLNRMSEGLEQTKNIDVDADTAKAQADLDQTKLKANSLPRRVKIAIVTNYKDIRRNFDRLATTWRNFDEIFAGTGRGLAMSLSTVVGPAIASTAGGLGALASAMTSAGVGAAGFAAVAVPAIKGVVEANEKLTEAQKAVDAASNPEERAKALRNLARVQSMYTDKQLETVGAMQEFSSFYSKFAKQFENPILDIFIQSMGVLKKVLLLSKPAIESTVGAVGRLMDAFERNLEADDIKEFFRWTGETAGGYLEKLTKAVGNFFVGFLNMMVGFDPLAQDFMDGFLNMSERFREWSDTLENNKGFQKFMQNTRENGPVLLDLLGNIVTTIVEFTQAVAPVATQVMKMANAFFAWTSELFKNHPWIAKVLAVVISLVGVFRLLAPILVPIITTFARLWPKVKVVWGWIKKLKGAFMRILPTILRVGSFLVRFATGPIGLAIQAIGLLVYFAVKYWDEIEAATKLVFRVIAEYIKSKWAEIEDTWEVIKILAQILKNQFDEMVSSVTEKMDEVWSTITDIWGDVESFFTDIDLFSIGVDIVSGLIRGIGSMAGNISRKVSSIASLIPAGIKEFLNINSPSRVTMALGEFAGQGLGVGLDKMAGNVAKSAKHLANEAVPPVERFKANGYEAVRRSNTATAAATTTSTRNSTSKDDSVYYFEIPVEVDGRQVAKATAKFTQEELDRMKSSKQRAGGVRRK